MISSRNRMFMVFLSALLMTHWMPADTVADDATPDARRIVEEMSDYLLGLRSFRVDLSLVVTIEAEGNKREMKTLSLFALERPNKVAQILKEGEMGLTLVCDGKKVYTYLPSLRSYTVADAPKSLAELSGKVGLAAGDAISAAKSLLADNPAETLMEKVVKSAYVDTEQMGGAECYRLRFEQEDLDWDAWISTGEKRLLMKVVPDFTKVIARAAQEGAGVPPEDFKYEMVLDLKNWATNPELPEDQFVFEPPERTMQVESFFPRKEPPTAPKVPKKPGAAEEDKK